MSMSSSKDKKSISLEKRGVCKKNEVIEGLNEFLILYLGLCV